MRNNRERFNAYRKKYHRQNRAYTLVSSCKQRAKKQGVPFDLDQHRSQIQARINAGSCELTGFPFDLANGRTFASPSIDRIEPKKGYVYSNIRVICDSMNMALGDWGEEKFYAVADAWFRERERKGITRQTLPCPTEDNRPLAVAVV